MILYPEYRGNPSTWKPVRLPAIPERLIKEMQSVGTVAGLPRFRIVDGTKATLNYEGDPELPRGTYLQYAALINVAQPDGYMYADGETWKKVSRASDVPSGKLAVPSTTYTDFGMPRYMVEVYRDAREPGIEESGYVWAWTVDMREQTTIDGERAEISLFRMPSAFDIEHARQLLRIIEMSTVESNKQSKQKFMAKRENRAAAEKEIRRERSAEAIERLVRDEL